MKWRIVNAFFLSVCFSFVISCNDRENAVLQAQLNSQSEIIGTLSQRGYYLIEKSSAENPEVFKPVFLIAREVKSLAENLNFYIEDTLLGKAAKHKEILKLLNRIQQINEKTASRHHAFAVPEIDLAAQYQSIFNTNQKEDKYGQLKLTLIKSLVSQWEFDFIKNLQKLLPKDNWQAHPVLFTQANKKVLQSGEPFEAKFHYFNVTNFDSRLLIGDFDSDNNKFITTPDSLEITKGVGTCTFVPINKNAKNQVSGAIVIKAPDGSFKYYYFISEKVIVN